MKSENTSCDDFMISRLLMCADDRFIMFYTIHFESTIN